MHKDNKKDSCLVMLLKEWKLLKHGGHILK